MQKGIALTSGNDEERNPLFDLLAGESNDIEGLTAYALYKRHKRKWADAHRTREKRDPTPEEERSFARSVSTDDQLERYRNDAQNILIGFANEAIEDSRPQIEENAISKRMEDAADRVESAGALKNILLIGVLSTLIVSAILALLALAVQLFGIDLIDALTVT